METVFQLLDEAEDLFRIAVVRVRRSLTLPVRERRRRPRLREFPRNTSSTTA